MSTRVNKVRELRIPSFPFFSQLVAFEKALLLLTCFKDQIVNINQLLGRTFLGINGHTCYALPPIFFWW